MPSVAHCNITFPFMSTSPYFLSFKTTIALYSGIIALKNETLNSTTNIKAPDQKKEPWKTGLEKVTERYYTNSTCRLHTNCKLTIKTNAVEGEEDISPSFSY